MTHWFQRLLAASSTLRTRASSCGLTLPSAPATRPGRGTRLAAAHDAVGRHRGGRVDAHPAFARLPVLDPGVGIALAHDVVAVHRGRVGALVAGDHARRHVHRAQHHHHAGREVLAEAELAVEPELVDRVLAVAAGLQRVQVVAAAQVLQHRGHQRARVGLRQAGLAAQRRGPFQRARVVVRRQRHMLAQRQRHLPRPVAVQQPGRGLEAQPLGHRPVGLPLQVAALPGANAFELRCRIGAVGRQLQQRQQRQAGCGSSVIS